MHPPNRKPTETFLGTAYVRDDLLRQEAHNNRPRRWVRAIARVALVLSVVVFAVSLVVGLGEAIGWVATYFIPVVVVLVVLFGAFGLLAWGALKLEGWGHKIS